MSDLNRIRAEVFGRPLLVEPGYAATFVGALAERVGVAGLTLPDGQRLDAAALEQRAAAEPPRGGAKIFRQVGDIAIIPVTGVIAHRFGFLDPVSGMVGSDAIGAKLKAAEADPSIKAVLLDINSPGGAVAGTFDLADRIARSPLHVWAVADELAASAGYALAAAADRVILPRTGRVGSIGVVMVHENRSGQMAQKGIEVSLIHAGQRKVDGHPFAALPGEVRERLQSEVDETHSMFVDSIARYRGMSASAVRATEAALYSGSHAVSAGLADAVMPANDVLAAFRRHIATGSAKPTRSKQGARSVEARPSINQIAANYWGEEQSACARAPSGQLSARELHRRRNSHEV